MDGFFVAFIGAGFAFCANAFLRAWQFKLEHWTGRTKTFVELVTKIADSATEYWCRASDTKERDRCVERQASVMGMFVRLDSLFLSFSEKLDSSEKAKIEEQLTAFTGAVTGGDFGAIDSIDIEAGGNRAREIHVRAAELISAVTSATDVALNEFWGRAFRRQ